MAVIAQDSVITPTPSPTTSPSRLLFHAEDRVRDQPTLQLLEDILDINTSHESVFFTDPTEHNSGFISSTGSLWAKREKTGYLGAGLATILISIQERTKSLVASGF